ncbi:hypothetical protein BGX30_014199 [Mortierella sp. GBA39]|nr:hypothetical protein BGX30_014199 [Mortierella sp. GBA39]
MAIGIAIDLHRIHVAVYRSSTRSTQFAFNLWLIGAAAFYFVIIYSEILDYFIPLSKVGIVTSNNSTVETATMITPGQHDQPLSSSSLQSTKPQKWEEIKYWIDCGLHLVLGLGLKAILNQRRQLDLEREEQQQHHLYHYLLVSSDKELPTPIASASSIEGFRTEAELAREYAQVAISLTQSITGLYILYRKSLVMTQWFFYSLCVTTAYQTISGNIGYWNEDFKKNFAELAETIENDEEGRAILEDFAGKSDEEILFMRVLYLTGATLFYLGRLWVAWRLVADLKERNARVARAVGLI